MEETFDHLVYSKNVIEFVTVAKEYCHFVETNNDFDRKQFVEVALKLLPLLYLKIIVLEKPEPMLNEALEKLVQEEDYQYLLDSVKVKLGKFNDYLEVFTPDIDRSEGAISESIAEDLADIYQDLKDFIENYKSAITEIMNDALLECVNNFQQYWGQKAVNCQRALHNIYFGDDNLLEEESEDKKEQNRNTEDWIFTRRQKEWEIDEDNFQK
ncbi:MAG: DUF5063 domain-containing protein [Marinilabiliaceae bacterium]|nr:DUF5063 domain-containing protein [Marinilabiliaceae bacterium]